MTFFGIESPEEQTEVYEHLLAIREIYDKRGYSSFSADNLLALWRIIAFARDDAFMTAFREYAEDSGDEAKLWKVHTYCWACQSASAIDGDFVECGVFRGLYSATMARYLEFSRSDRRLYLYDTFEGIPEAGSTEIERRFNIVYDEEKDLYARVIERFAEFTNVEVVKGVVPEVLDDIAPDHIAFLHVDLNASAAETAALDKLFDRVTDGGIVLLDDYGRGEQISVFKAHSEWFSDRNYPILEIPTGQGLIIKRRV